MKKVLLLSCLSLSGIAAFAQNGFFLQPVAGIGAANVNHIDYNMHATRDNYAINLMVVSWPVTRRASGCSAAGWYICEPALKTR